MSDIDVLESVLAKDEQLLAGIKQSQLGAATQCPDYDVRALANHLVGWLEVFAAGANDRAFDGDPAAFATDDPAGDFRAAASDTVAGWRAGGVDRKVRLTGSPMPGQLLLSMTLMEYTAHGCDLAVATGQPVPFSDDELTVALKRARATLPDQYRGEGKAFANVIEVAEDAPILDRFLGFMGRQPSAAH